MKPEDRPRGRSEVGEVLDLLFEVRSTVLMNDRLADPSMDRAPLLLNLWLPIILDLCRECVRSRVEGVSDRGVSPPTVVRSALLAELHFDRRHTSIVLDPRNT